MTILSILIGQILAGILFDVRLRETGEGWSAALPPILILTGACFIAVVLARLIEKTPAHDAGPLTTKVAFRHVRDFKVVWSNRSLRLSALGVAFFWGFASFMLLAVFQVAKDLHGGGEGTGTANSLMMATASIGIALGSIGAGFLSRKGTELGLVPIGGLVMTLGTLFMVFTVPGSVLFCVGLLVGGGGAAVFLVPLKAHLIDLSPSDERGKILSVSNLMNNLAGAIAVGLQFAFELVSLSIGWQMAFFALMAGATTIYVMKILPKQFFYFVLLKLIRSLYRIKTVDDGNVPKEGGVLLCPNHMTFVDSFVMTAASPRPVRFLVAETYYHHKVIGKFLKLFDPVPVSPERAKEAIRIAADEVAAGNVVCIFAEGQLSRSGAVSEVKRGFEMIARKANCPVVPAYMHGLWGTFTSFSGGKYFRKWPRRLGSGLTISFGEPMEPREATADAVGKIWREMASESLDKETLDLREFADTSHFLDPEPANLREELNEFQKLSQEDFAPLVRQTCELNAVAFWNRGERVLLEWSPGDEVSRILGLMLPRQAGVKVALIAPGQSENEILEIARKMRINRIVLRRKEVAESFVESAKSESRLVQLLESWEGDEKALKMEGVYPSLVESGRIVTWSMPHPNEKDSILTTFQPGWKEGHVGRLLPGQSAPEGWAADKERFLKKEETGASQVES